MVELPRQRVVLPLIITTGLFTVILTESIPVPQISVMVSVYVVVAVGLAIGFWQVIQLKVAPGDQEKAPAPLPKSVVLLPGHIVASVPALAEGDAGVVTLRISDIVPQLFVTVSVYVIVAV